MRIVFSIVVAVRLTFVLRSSLRHHPYRYYFGAGAISLLLGFWTIPSATSWLDTYILDLFRRGTLATALWCIVMFAGALPNGKLKRIWMPLRGTLSILAAILTLCHTITYIRIYASPVARPSLPMSGPQIVAIHLSVFLLLIMIPLTILSFPTIRSKISPKRWIAIQRLAYVFYLLLYVHIMLLLMPSATTGHLDAQISIFTYSLIYLSYFVLRIKKAVASRHGRSGCAASLLES